MTVLLVYLCGWAIATLLAFGYIRAYKPGAGFSDFLAAVMIGLLWPIILAAAAG